MMQLKNLLLHTCNIEHSMVSVKLAETHLNVGKCNVWTFEISMLEVPGAQTRGYICTIV